MLYFIKMLNYFNKICLDNLYNILDYLKFEDLYKIQDYIFKDNIKSINYLKLRRLDECPSINCLVEKRKNYINCCVPPFVYAYVVEYVEQIIDDLEEMYYSDNTDLQLLYSQYTDILNEGDYIGVYTPYYNTDMYPVLGLKSDNSVDILHMTDSWYDFGDKKLYKKMKEFFKEHNIVQIVYCGYKIICLDDKGVVYIWGHSTGCNSSRETMGGMSVEIYYPQVMYQTMFGHVIYIDKELIVNNDGEVWMWNYQNFLRLKGIDHHINLLKQDGYEKYMLHIPITETVL